jgi:hypothetical protein
MSKLKENLCDYCGEPIPNSYEGGDSFCSEECRLQDEEDNADTKCHCGSDCEKTIDGYWKCTKNKI